MNKNDNTGPEVAGAYQLALKGLERAGATLGGMVCAMRFIQLVQDRLGCPEVMVEEDGDIGLDWHRPNGATVSVSVHHTQLKCAWVIGDYAGHAAYHFDGRRLPAGLEKAFQRFEEY